MATIFQTSEQRKARVFVSSTFSDLTSERDYLVRVIFPRIRKFCRERDIEFIEIDLRWGITEEEAQQGKVISICLKEIEQSRPYFIGILKDRYGWVPDETILKSYSELSVNFPWIAGDISERLSITEMEIQFGVLRNPLYQNMDSPNAFFFIKSTGKIIETSNDPDSLKLQNLKNRLINQSLFPVVFFNHTKELGDSVYQQLTQSIAKSFPEVKTTPLEKIRNEHIDFARNRLRVYINDNQLFDILDRHVETDGPPLLVTGVSGMGKTALIANWLKHYNTLHPDLYVFFHFTGSSADSTNHLNLVRRLMEEIKIEYGIGETIPTKPDEMVMALPGFLASTNVGGKKWVLILDGVKPVGK
jgi:nephrocystin-3